MKISVSMYSLASTIRKENWSIVDFIDYASSISSDWVELLDIYWTNKEDKYEEIGEVLTALKSCQLQVSAYDIMNNFVKE
ncbi:hypothetical protein GGGNBK_13840 [Sporosarcina sp. ANT_H38]|uniref:hypothetical protein n=1 Tax=Sporosarcina sp. ANT_H38 TaxID=2597358 RepID=UPI0021080D22|nr:hypothetical protein [Sporosarcina sp. ANT_H38]